MFKNFLAFILFKLFDRRGEIGELDASQLADGIVVDSDDQETDDQDAGASDDETDDTDDSEADDTDTEDSDDDDESDDGEKDTKDKKAKTDEPDERDKKIEDLQKEINRLGFKVRQTEKAPPAKPEAEFTDAQLYQMMEEHKDDPKVLFQVMRQMVTQGSKAAEDSAEAKVQIAQQRKDFDGMVGEMYPEARNKGSALHTNISETVDYLGLTEHPHGEFLALAAMHMKNTPTLLNQIREDMKKDLTGKATEAKRKASIKSKTLSDKGKNTPKTPALSKGLNETAGRLNMNDRQKEIYAKFMKNKDGALSAEA